MIAVYDRIRKMPRPLLFFSLTPWVVMSLFFWYSLTPEFQVDIHGKIASRNQWWASGGGVLVSIGFFVFSLQFVAVLCRLKSSRFFVALAWIIFAIAEYLLGPEIEMAFSGKSNSEWIFISGFSASIGVASLIYSAFNSAVRAYLS